MFDEAELAALALTSSLTPAAVEPLTAAEYWKLTRSVEPAALRGRSAQALSADFGFAQSEAERVALLLDRGVGLALALERLSHLGVWTLTALSDQYPARLRSMLSDHAPVYLHGVGDSTALSVPGMGVASTADTATEVAKASRACADAAVRADLPVITRARKGAEREAMNEAVTAGGRAIGVIEKSLLDELSKPSMRKAVLRGQVSLLTDHPPDTGRREPTETSSTAIVFGLARCTFLIGPCDSRLDASAKQAIANGSRVVYWSGRADESSDYAPANDGIARLSNLEEAGNMLLADPGRSRAREPERSGEQLTFGY